MTAPLLTIFTTCKPFQGKFQTLQRNALRSWARLRPECDVVVVGDEPGVEECCRELGLRHIAEVPRSESGTPLLDGLVAVAERAAKSELLALVNADIMLTHDIIPAVETARSRFGRFLLIVRRWNVDLDHEWNFTVDWEAALVRYAQERGQLEAPYGGMDVFVFPRGMWQQLPPFAIGRTRWDSGLIYQARARDIPVIDATDGVTCVHPNHDYSHHPASTAGVYKGPEAIRNEALLGGPQFIFSALNATHVLDASGIRRRVQLNPAYLLRRLATAPALYPSLQPLAPLIGRLAPWWRTLRRPFARVAFALRKVTWVNIRQKGVLNVAAAVSGRAAGALLSVLFRLLPEGMWRWVGPRLAECRGLEWVPGWKFGTAGAETSVWGLLRLALWWDFKRRGRSIPIVVRWHDGLRVAMYPGNDLSYCLFVGGTYEPNEFMFLSRVLRPGMIFVDVGANDGLYTLFAARRVGVTGRVVALEPSTRELDRLRQNLALNRVTNVTALRLAAGDRDGTAQLRIAGFGHEGQNTLGGFAYAVEGAGFEEVEVACLDRLVENQALDRVDALKIDAEGAELRVLRGASALLRRHRPLIILELVDAALRHQGASREDVLSLLNEHGYRIWVFGASGVPEPVGSVELDGVNIIAVHRESDVMTRETLDGRVRGDVNAPAQPSLATALSSLTGLWRRLRARQSRWRRERRIARSLSTGLLPYPISVGPVPLYPAAARPGDGVECFDTPEALELNQARVDHLRALELPLRGKRVLDVGCGVGHLAQFFVGQGCDVLCVDARKENIERLGELYPGLKARVFDVERDSFEDLGRFDIVFAYGVIYHLEDPFRALRNLAGVCDDLLLLETMVADHPLPLVRMAEETSTSNQAMRNVGSRPTPSFVALALRSAGFRHIYGPRTPPAHRDFRFTWTGDLSDSRGGHLLRCTFVASRTPLTNPSLVDLLS
jgi:FkbM family methyltransferase